MSVGICAFHAFLSLLSFLGSYFPLIFWLIFWMLLGSSLLFPKLLSHLDHSFVAVLFYWGEDRWNHCLVFNSQRVSPTWQATSMLIWLREPPSGLVDRFFHIVLFLCSRRFLSNRGYTRAHHGVNPYPWPPTSSVSLPITGLLHWLQCSGSRHPGGGALCLHPPLTPPWLHRPSDYRCSEHLLPVLLPLTVES